MGARKNSTATIAIIFPANNTRLTRSTVPVPTVTTKATIKVNSKVPLELSTFTPVKSVIRWVNCAPPPAM
ncbi:Uncharacterised protein [Vibrio cholerae]|nr:Uncharacterised protein [Vibrio cholerae]